METKKLAESIGKFLSDKKAEDVSLISVSDKTIIADYFIIATGSSMTHVRALCENLEEEMDKNGIAPLRREGIREGRWAVLDYGDIIVHIFNDESRDFYNLEKLWAGSDIIKIED